MATANSSCKLTENNTVTNSAHMYKQQKIVANTAHQYFLCRIIGMYLSRSKQFLYWDMVYKRKKMIQNTFLSYRTF